MHVACMFHVTCMHGFGTFSMHATCMLHDMRITCVQPLIFGLNIVFESTVAQKGHPSLQFFKVTFCKLAIFQFYTFANMQFINQALLQTTCCLSICIQYPNSKGISNENYDVYAQEMHAHHIITVHGAHYNVIAAISHIY